MRSATREALSTARAELAAMGAVDLATGENLFEAARAIGNSFQLLGALSDPVADSSAKVALVDAVFTKAVTPNALRLLETVAGGRWSGSDDLLSGIEDLGLRSVAISAPANTRIEAELFTVQAIVSSDDGLELALSDKLGRSEAKAGLVESLLDGKASAQTVAIVRHLVLLPRGRRIGEMLDYAASVVADQADTIIATVTSAGPIDAPRLDRLKAGLARRYGRDITVNQVIDPSVVGGLRVQIGDDVIDGSVATRLHDLKLQLAG
ncbi:F0F1 ATP synthase subunit delta [Cryobacterium tepidiphilum]|uniref:ATP synthase subunit delta n=1 Tax=Cryobacterium tepidiphilum TaxID=2486026 RepID=A0A3M8LDZ6_9MICO|nr:F0F1 ATP synthase subunit delta [Cryobacterium tepidiphilum]RNE63660.1 F0F1 ATP synthase subunit delta [Cryobacterium tepidiphilum]